MRGYKFGCVIELFLTLLRHSNTGNTVFEPHNPSGHERGTASIEKEEKKAEETGKEAKGRQEEKDGSVVQSKGNA